MRSVARNLLLSSLLALYACSGDDTIKETNDGGDALHGGGGDGKAGSSGKGGGDQFGNGPSDGGVGTGGDLRDGSASGGAAGTANVCANVDVSATRVIPTVILIIDQSGSMTTAFDGAADRWNALRSFLLASDGLVHDLQGQVRFGLAMYSATSDANNQALPVGECPTVTTVAPALDNFDAIAATYNAASPIDETPTGDSIDKIVSTLDLTKLDTDSAPVVFILATDGEPDRCEELNPQNGQQESIDAVTRAFTLGIRTFIISVGNEVSAQHQQDVANAGVGTKPGDPNAEYWTAGDDATLRTAISDIIGKQLSCDIKLEGSVEGGNACDGSVKLNGKALACNGKDGWKLLDPTHIRLQGKACTNLKTLPGAMLTVSFPCSVPILF